MRRAGWPFLPWGKPAFIPGLVIFLKLPLHRGRTPPLSRGGHVVLTWAVTLRCPTSPQEAAAAGELPAHGTRGWAGSSPTGPSLRRRFSTWLYFHTLSCLHWSSFLVLLFEIHYNNFWKGLICEGVIAISLVLLWPCKGLPWAHRLSLSTLSRKK